MASKVAGQLFDKVLIAKSRGEIALRIQRACRELGIKTVVVHSEADSEALRALADESVCIGPPPSDQSYLDVPAIISAAEVDRRAGDPSGLRLLVRKRGLRRKSGKERWFVFIGPRPGPIRLMGDRVSAKVAITKAGVPCVPGLRGCIARGP